MDISRQSRVSDIATAAPATIRIFQGHGIDFCCGGKRPLAEACAERGLDVDLVVTELKGVASVAGDGRTWQEAPLAELVAHIQRRFHEPLRAELPRLGAMMAKVVSRHGDHLPQTLHPLQAVLTELTEDLLQHMAKEDGVLFPAIAALDAGGAGAGPGIGQPIAVMEAEHDEAARRLSRMRELTADYTPPEWACPTFRGLYYGLAELEREMHVHVHLENNVLFPRAASFAHEAAG
ncbi:MAG: iron-sulfur cluster repair di-iron protein [Acidobacteria bacterium]|nr:iron-sulfur cluster repair di-iron protein [Acidobacteriota bacterium]